MFPEKFFERRKLSEFVPEYLKKHAAHTRSYDFCAVMCKKLVSYFVEMYLDEITCYRVKPYQSERSEQVSVYTVNREVTILKGICTKAIDWGFQLGREKSRASSHSLSRSAKNLRNPWRY